MSITVERLTSSIARAEYSTGEWANSRNRPRLTIGAPSTAALAIAARFSNARLLSLSVALDVEIDLFMVVENTPSLEPPVAKIARSLYSTFLLC
jgi:hypothetical protein